jgi:hypothetical protein
MSYPIEVVAEKGTLQRRLGLTPIDRTSTADFPKGKVTIRTNKVPTLSEGGAYAFYYSNPKGYRAVCHVGPVFEYTSQGRVVSDEMYYHFNSGVLKKSELDAFVGTIKAIEAKVDALMRKESNGYQEEIS